MSPYPTAVRAVLLLFAATQATAGIEVVPEWVRVGDPSGSIDRDNGTASVESAEFSPDGSLIVSASKQVPTIALWRVSDGALLWSRGRAEEVEVVTFSRDGRLIAAAGEDDLLELIDVASGNIVSRMSLPASADGMRFSPDGRLLAVGTESQELMLIRTEDWQVLSRTRHGGQGDQAVNSIDFTGDGRTLATAGTNGEVKVWRLADPERGQLDLLLTLRTIRTAKSVRISPDGTLMACGSGHGEGIWVWSLPEGKLLARLRIPPDPHRPITNEVVEWTPDGSWLFTGGDEGKDRGGPEDGIGLIRIHSTADLRAGRIEPATKLSVFRQEYFHFTSDGKRFLSTHEDGTLRLWKIAK